MIHLYAPVKDDPLTLFLDALLFVYKYALVSLTKKPPICILPFPPKSEISLPPLSPFPFSLIIWLGPSYQNCFKPVGLNWGIWMDFKSNSPETTDKALWICTFGRENVCFIDHWCSTMANRVTASCYCVPSSQHELQVATTTWTSELPWFIQSWMTSGFLSFLLLFKGDGGR